jgi:hypothetical protein
MRVPITLLTLLLVCPLGHGQAQVWIQQHGTANPDDCWDVADGGGGFMYACGATRGALFGPSSGFEDAWLARLDAAGTIQWAQQIGTSTDDQARAVASDGTGGFYACGHTRGDLGGINAGGWDAWFARYDSAGTQLWIRQVGTPSTDLANAATSDGRGGLFVTGESQGAFGGPAGDYKGWVLRYDSLGNLLWIRQIAADGVTRGHGVATDSAGGVYVCGYTTGSLAAPNAGFSDPWLARFDGAGTLLWTRQIGTTYLDSAQTVSPDGVGGVFVGGYASGSIGGTYGGSYDAWVARYDASGQQLWIRQIGTASGEFVHASAEDGVGGVYLAGYTEGSLDGQNAGGMDAWLVRFDADGVQLGLSQIGSTGADYAYAAAPDGSGGLVIAGSTIGNLAATNGGSWDIWLARYDACSAWNYCAGTTNSTGKSAGIGHKGSTSLAQNDFALGVASCPPEQIGIFFFGQYTTQVPFGDGWLCVTGNQKRLMPPVFLGSTGAGSLQVDFSDPSSPASSITAGSVRHFQFWYRDPQLVGNDFNLSDGLSAYFCP